MATITVRIYPALYESLNTVSEQTGIPKSSLILYALNDQLRLKNNFEELDYSPVSGKSDDSIRFTLRLPDSLKELLQTASAANNISTNQLINECVNHFKVLYWQAYAKEQ
ncbi:MAG: ribbon-helix-helix domain-containing protein [Eubacteriales bacterium]|nr:ribbon-helix-helix domain-containing protein [Eubacteriales bacterium]